MNTRDLILIAAGIFFVYKLLQKFGVFDDATDRQNKQTLSEVDENPLSTKYIADVRYKKIPHTLLSRAETKKIAEQIYDAKGYIYDTDGQAIAAFSKLANKAQVSFLAEVFRDVYRRSLIEYLTFMSDSSLLQLRQLINDLPKYK